MVLSALKHIVQVIRSTYMNKAIVYHSIRKKVVKDKVRLSDGEAFIRALDLIDFYAALNSLNKEQRISPTRIDWIELKYNSQ